MDPLWYLFAAHRDPPPPGLEPPGTPGAITVTNIQPDRVTVNWSAPISGGEVENYIVAIIYPDTGVVESSTGVDGETFTAVVDGLNPATEYRARVRANNAAGTTTQLSSIFESGPAGAPASPSGLSAARTSASNVTLNWTSNSGSTEDGFRIYRAVEGGAFSELATVGTNVTEYIDTTATGDDQYCYYVTGFIVDAESAESNTDCVGEPQPPSGLAADPVSGSQINLSWDAESGADSYEVLRGGTVVGTPTSNSFSDTGRTENTSYSYTVRTVRSGLKSDESGSVSQTTRLNTPGTLAGTQIGGTGPTGFVRFTWDNSSAVNDEYVLIRDGSDYRSLGASVTQTDVTNPDTDATFTVQARGSGKLDSQVSNEAAPPWFE